VLFLTGDGRSGLGAFSNCCVKSRRRLVVSLSRDLVAGRRDDAGVGAILCFRFVAGVRDG